MRARTVLWLAASSAAAAADARWATVPANPAGPVATALTVAGTPDESWVQWVGPRARAAAPAPGAAPAPVVALSLPAAAPAPEPVASIPLSARWPDPAGRIAEVPSAGGGAAPPRNPWLARPQGAETRRTETYFFGGYIAGGPAGPVGLVNGRAVHRGERLGSFVVDQILGLAVVLERDGARYVLPRGVRTAIELHPA